MTPGLVRSLLAYVLGFFALPLAAAGQDASHVRPVDTGYGEMRPYAHTGSPMTEVVASRAPEPQPRPLLLLQGRVTSVDVIDSPEPAGGVSLRVRGGSSILFNEPLYVLNGVPLPHAGGISAGSSPLHFIDDDDVRRMVVLRDAASTAMYGSRGANGVVLIETRSGRTGTAYRGNVSATSTLRDPSVLSAARYRQLVAAYDAANGTDISDLLGDASTDWRDEVQRTGIGHDHMLSWYGLLAEGVALGLSGGYASREGVVDESASRRGNVGANLEAYLFDGGAPGWLHVEANVRGSHTDDRFTPRDVLANSLLFAPTQPIRDDTSSFGGFFEWRNELTPGNPVAILALTSDEGTTRRGGGDVSAAYTIKLPGVGPPHAYGWEHAVTATIRAGYDVTDVERDVFQSPELYIQARRDEAAGFRGAADMSNTNTLMEASLDYDHSLAAAHVRLTAGLSRESSKTDAEIDREEGMPPVGGSGIEVEQDASLSSLFARGNVFLRGGYVVTAGLRSDRYDAFGVFDDRLTHPFAGVAWHLEQAGFMRYGRPFEELKLRASWGRAGNLSFGVLAHVPAYQIGDYTTTLMYGGLLGGGIGGPFDPDLEPEQVTTIDAGLDFVLANDGVRGSIDWYRKMTDDLIGQGFLVPGVTNIGSLENTGIELSLDVRLPFYRRSRLDWDVGFVVARNRAEITDLEGSVVFMGGSVLVEGEAPGAFHVLERRRDNPEFGDIDDDGDVDEFDLYVDRDENGIIDFGDQRAFGNAAPEWIIGHTSRLSWRRFDASFGLRAHIGNHVRNGAAALLGAYRGLEFPNAPFNVHESVFETNFEDWQFDSDYYVEDASFLRMDHLTLGWSPGSNGLWGGRGAEGVRVYATVRNVFTLTDYRGIDPVVGPSGSETIATYPRARTLTVGADVVF